VHAPDADQEFGADGISATGDQFFDQPLDPLLRVYWAVVTGRDAMVELLWAQVGASAGTSCDTPSSPFVAAFLCNYVYRLRDTSDHNQNSPWID
jgi:hypothetical protein